MFLRSAHFVRAPRASRLSAPVPPCMSAFGQEWSCARHDSDFPVNQPLIPVSYAPGICAWPRVCFCMLQAPALKITELQSPNLVIEQFFEELRQRCDGFEPISEGDLRYAFLHVLERLASVTPCCVRLEYRLYRNDRLKLDLVVRHQQQHLMACEFKIHVSHRPRRADARSILNDLSRLALANVMWGSGNTGCPSYFVHLYSDAFSDFVQSRAPLLAGLLYAPIGTETSFDIRTKVDLMPWNRKKPPSHMKRPFELDLHSGRAQCIGRICLADDSTKRWSLSVFKVIGDEHLALDY